MNNLKVMFLGILFFMLSNLVTAQWTQLGQDVFNESESFESISLSADGSIVAIGAPGDDGNFVGSGHVRVFKNINDVWTQIGSDIDGGKGSSVVSGIQLGDNSGLSVSLSSDGSIVAIGAHLNGDNGEQSGQVRVFEYNNTNWTQIGQDINGELGELSGINVSLANDGTVVAIGSNNSKYARVYGNINNDWTQIGEDILQYSDDGRIEVSLNSDGSYLVTGMPNAISNQGTSKLFENVNDSWVQINEQIIGSQTADYFGTSVDINANGSIIALAGLGEMPNGLSTGLVRVYQNDSVLGIDEFSSSSLSVYPNPTKDILTINSKFPIDTIEVYSMLGKKVVEIADAASIALGKLSAGVYLVKISSNNTAISKKIVVE